MVERHTRNNHRLTTHDENDFHRTELPHTESLPLLDSIAQLPDKDDTKETNANRNSNVSRTFKPLNPDTTPRMCNMLRRLNDISKPKSQRNKRNNHRHAQEQPAIKTS